ncbi:uncharacterized protein LOC141573378 [Camelus bactrianus]|uniref:Uncharacterized protein LOC141573378 n=1 Tax=Camelus bactrianus TaxID=9837 RepID=A0AC58NIH9_CAMBA
MADKGSVSLSSAEGAPERGQPVQIRVPIRRPVRSHPAPAHHAGAQDGFACSFQQRQENQAQDSKVTRPKAEKATSPKLTVPQGGVVPGRLTEAEGAKLRAREEGEEVVGDILEELVDPVMDAACKSYLERQCIPYAVNGARETILHVVQMRFVPRDEGEPHLAEDPTWAEDEEPSPCPTDTWARAVRALLGGTEEEPRQRPGPQGSGEPGSSERASPCAWSPQGQVPGGEEAHVAAESAEDGSWCAHVEPTTQELLSCAEAQQEDKEGSTSRPIHTGAPDPQVMVAQLTKVRSSISSLYSKHPPHPGP